MYFKKSTIFFIGALFIVIMTSLFVIERNIALRGSRFEEVEFPEVEKEHNVRQGVLQFKSGFEGQVRVEKGRRIVGKDSSAPKGVNDWDKLTDYLSWNKKTGAYIQGGSMEITRDPENPRNRVLHFHNKKPNPTKRNSRTEWKLNQVLADERFGHNFNYGEGDPNLFDKQFYRMKMFIPKALKNAVSSNEKAPWYMIWESHAWRGEPVRHGIYLQKPKNGIWSFNVRQQFVKDEGKPISWQKNQPVEVPFGEWFTLDIFFKYHETQGEFYASITRQGKSRQKLGHYKGPTKFGYKLVDQQPFKLYHDSKWLKKIPSGIHQYYDDFEIWSDFPPGYIK